jgi:hypothetical protein
MEDGSDWPLIPEGAATSCVALKQEPHETTACLLHRAIRRIRRIEDAGGAVERIVMSCSGDASARAVEARSTLSRALLEPLLDDGEDGRFELVASDRASSTTKQSLVALAGVLTQAAGTHASIVMRFTGTGGWREASLAEPLTRYSEGAQLERTRSATRSAATGPLRTRARLAPAASGTSNRERRF